MAEYRIVRKEIDSEFPRNAPPEFFDGYWWRAQVRRWWGWKNLGIDRTSRHRALADIPHYEYVE